MRMWNLQPSTKWRKCLIDKYTARGSWSKVLYNVSAMSAMMLVGISGLDVREGCHYNSKRLLD